MATIGFNNEKSINVNLSSEPKLNTEIKNLNYIPDYKKYELERQENEIKRETYINELKQRVLGGEFKGDDGKDGLTTSITLNGETKEHVNGNIDLGNLQKPLVSGKNIKTINNQSLLGEGNIEISGGGSGGTTDYNDLTNKPITNLVGTEDNPVILLDLESGLYKLSGKVKKHATEEYTSSLNSVIMVKKIASNNIRYIDLNPGYSSDYSSYLLNITELKYNEENGLTIKGGVIRDSNYVETIIDDKIQSAIGNALKGSY